jgi:hypothetical protein
MFCNIATTKGHYTMRRWVLLLLAILSSVIAAPALTQTASSPFGLSISLSNTEATPVVNRKRDMLAYVSPQNHLMLYDPQSRTQTTLLQNVKDFVMAQTGKVAFTKPDENDKNIYVYDPATPSTSPINITLNASTLDYLKSWSPDGRYLAFVTDQDDKTQTLHVWDGKTIQDITPRNEELGKPNWFYTTWSQDGRLAITVMYVWSGKDDAPLNPPPEIFIWDGLKTMNLSQNPKGWDQSVSWSKSGKLMFILRIDGEYGLYIWDGMSFTKGIPDADKFAHVAPEMNPSYATWMDNGLVALSIEPSSLSDKKQIVLWDAARNTEIKRIPVASNKYYSWLTEDGQTILSSNLASGIPSIYLDVENTKGKIQFSAHVGEYSWSTSGYLAFCGINGSKSELLSLWNGSESWLVETVSYKPAQWQSEEYTFSCNNG